MILTIGGRTQTVAAWARESGISSRTLRRRVMAGVVGDDVLAPKKEKRRPEVLTRWRSDGTEMWPGARDLRYDDDRIARHMIANHGPFTAIEVAAFMGLGRDRIDQIERAAIAKIRLAGLTLDDLAGDRGEMVYPEAGGW